MESQDESRDGDRSPSDNSPEKTDEPRSIVESRSMKRGFRIDDITDKIGMPGWRILDGTRDVTPEDL